MKKPGRTIIELLIESVFIVISVFVALAVDNFREDQVEANKSREYLSSLRTSIESDTAVIKNEIENFYLRQESVRSLLMLIESDSIVSDIEFENILRGVFLTEDMVYSTSVYEELKYTGNLRLFKNDDFKADIVGYYVFLEKFQKRMESNHWFVQHEYILTDAINYDEWTFKKPFSQKEILANYRGDKSVSIVLKRLLKYHEVIKNSLIYTSLPKSIETLNVIVKEQERLQD